MPTVKSLGYFETVRDLIKMVHIPYWIRNCTAGQHLCFRKTDSNKYNFSFTKIKKRLAFYYDCTGTICVGLIGFFFTQRLKSGCVIFTFQVISGQDVAG